MSAAIVDAAIQWAKRGVPVFPCSTDDKSPLTKNGHLDATTDVEKVRAMFDFYGDDVLIGARMGKQSRLFACDFDLYKEGAEQYMNELSDKGLLTSTQIHTTRSGGVHMLYRSDNDFPNCVPHAGVEVKGEGGYIIVPPSKGYAIQQSGIAYAKPELIAALIAAKRVSSQSTVDTLKAKVLSGAEFHEALAAIAARRSAQGWDQAKVQQEILATLAASVASNPDHARYSRWKKLMADDGGELSRVVNSGHDKFSPQAKTDKAREQVSSATLDRLTVASDAVFSSRKPDDQLSVEAEVQKLLPSEGNEWPFANEGYFSGEERSLLDQKYILYPLFSERETVLIAAEPKAGKTAISLKLAMSVASGESIGEKLAISEARPVLYFTLEGARAVEMRIAAERGSRKDAGKPWPEQDMLFVVDRPQNLLKDDEQAKFCAKVVAHSRRCEQLFGTSLGLIFIDTLTKAMPGGDQNSVEDTSQLFKITDVLRAFGITATVVFIHHLGKDNNVRGSTNIEAEVDVITSVEKTKTPGIVKLIIRRARSIDESVSYTFKLSSYYLGTTVQGHKLNAPVVTLVESEDVTTTGAAARDASKWAKLCDVLIEQLGVGKFQLGAVYPVLANAGYVTKMMVGRRPNYTTDAVQKPLKLLFEGRLNWSYSDYWMSVQRDSNDQITGIEIRNTL